MSKQELPKWQELDERFVLYMDIMGFKDRVMAKTTKKLKESLLDLRAKNKKLKPLLDGGGNAEKLMKMVQFSDSILVVSYGKEKDDLNRITKAAVILMQSALETKFALRGAIACGEMVFDEKNQLFVGKPLVDAYLLEQEMCHYGIIFHHSAEEIVKKVADEMKEKGSVPINEKERYFPIKDCEINLKGGKSKHYQILWHQVKDNLRQGDISKEALQWLDELRKRVSGNPRVYLDNTREFIEKETN